MNDNTDNEKYKQLQELLIVEYKEGKNDLRLHAQLIWTVISIFYATTGILYMGYSQPITSPKYGIIIALFGYLFSIVITILILAERRRWSIEIEKSNQIKNMLVSAPFYIEDSNKRDQWLDNSKKIILKPLDNFFNEIDGKESVILRGYRIEIKSVFLYQLVVQFILITIWGYIIYDAVVRYNLEFCLYQGGILCLILLIIAFVIIWIIIRKQNNTIPRKEEEYDP